MTLQGLDVAAVLESVDKVVLTLTTPRRPEVFDLTSSCARRGIAVSMVRSRTTFMSQDTSGMISMGSLCCSYCQSLRPKHRLKGQPDRNSVMSGVSALTKNQNGPRLYRRADYKRVCMKLKDPSVSSKK